MFFCSVFPGVEGVPKSDSQAIVDQKRPKADDPPSAEQWQKVNKMVALSL